MTTESNWQNDSLSYFFFLEEIFKEKRKFTENGFFLCLRMIKDMHIWAVENKLMQPQKLHMQYAYISNHINIQKGHKEL